MLESVILCWSQRFYIEVSDSVLESRIMYLSQGFMDIVLF